MVDRFQSNFKSGKPWEETFRMRNRQGEYRWFLCRAIPMHAPNGDLNRWFGTNTDITERKKAEAALQESETRFRMLADNMDQLAWVVDAEGRATWFNARWAEFTGLPLDQIRENGGRHLYHPDDKEQLAQLFPRKFKEQKQWEEVFRLRNKEGEYHWFLSRAIPIFDDAGNLICWFGTNTDITHSKTTEMALQESEERFRLMADNMDQLAWIATADGSSFWFNKRYEEFTGWPADQILSRAEELHHPDHYQEVTCTLTEAGQRGEPWEAKFPLKRKDGEWRWFLARAIPSRNDEGVITRWFCTCTDITDLRQAEEALKVADQRKDSFLAILAHELRSPLAPLRNGVELLGLLEPHDPEGKRVQEMMQRQMKHMVRLIDDLMDLSRISRDLIQLDQKPLHLQQPVEHAIEAVRAAMDAKNIVFTQKVEQKDLVVHGDETRVTQMITNLLNNAAKYTPQGGEVTLLVQREKYHAAIAVKDTGIGLENHMIPEVFGMFTQVDSAQSTTGGGLGIGLHIVKRLVEKHGGEIIAHSDGLGKGSTFTIKLPLIKTLPRNAEPTNGSGVLQRRRVLVVDDNADSAGSMAALLRMLGQETFTANDGAAAVRMAEQERPDLILMDIGMPHMNGYEACEKIRSHDWGKAMLVVALTGWGLENDRTRSKKAGFDDHLVKPIAKDKLVEILREPVQALRESQD